MHNTHEPLTTSLLTELIGRLHVAFPRTIGKDNPAMMADVYRSGLRGLPGDAVRVAVDQVIQTEEYFPKVSKIRELAMAYNRKRTIELRHEVSWDVCGMCGARARLIDVFRPTGEKDVDGEPIMRVAFQRYAIEHNRRGHNLPANEQEGVA